MAQPWQPNYYKALSCSCFLVYPTVYHAFLLMDHLAVPEDAVLGIGVPLLVRNDLKCPLQRRHGGLSDFVKLVKEYLDDVEAKLNPRTTRSDSFPATLQSILYFRFLSVYFNQDDQHLRVEDFTSKDGEHINSECLKDLIASDKKNLDWQRRSWNARMNLCRKVYGLLHELDSCGYLSQPPAAKISLSIMIMINTVLLHSEPDLGPVWSLRRLSDEF